LVKTTPNPSATKKRSGELDPPLPLLLFEELLVLAAGAAEAEVEAEVDILERTDSPRLKNKSES
jgi:hypothetical protein